MDRLTPAGRSANMARIKGKDTAPERAVRSALHRLGFRFRLHDGKLPGTPDIVLRSRRTVVLVHGCFWHRHPRCSFAYTPKSRQEFWMKKFADNVERDRRQRRTLQRAGWNVVTVWECQTRERLTLAARLRMVLANLTRSARLGR